MKVATGPYEIAPKISKSLINTPLGVNKPVAFEARKEPLDWVVLFTLAETTKMDSAKISERHHDFGYAENAGYFLLRHAPIPFWSSK